METQKATNDRKWNLNWMLISLMLSGLCGRPGTSVAAEDTWTYRTDMPTSRGFTSGCIAEGKIYVTGGFPTHFSVTSAVETYDPITDTWTKMANMPSGRCGHATCALDGKIYVFGGTSPDPYGPAQRNVYEYDIQTNTWTHKADMPYANALCGIAVVDSTIYLIGGTRSSSSPPIRTVMAYDPATESWTQKADMPTARGFLSACTVDGKIYAIGGGPQNWGQRCYNHVEVYHPSTDTWSRKSNMPTARAALGTCIVNRQIYAIGGFSPAGIHTANEVYDPTLNTWTTKSPLQQKRLMPFVGSVAGKVYVTGGSYPDAQGQPVILSLLEEYDTGLGVPSPDLNGDFVIDIADLTLLIESWGQDDPAVDIAPPPFGDGLVDALDLELMMSHWGQALPDPALIAHWKFDETEGAIAYDSAGLNDATVVGIPAWQPAGGVVDGALMFDGTTFVTADFALNPSDEFSVFAWIKGGMPGQVIISQEDGTDWLLTDAQDCLMTQLKSGGRRSDPLYSGIVVSNGNWHRVGFSWDGTNRILYVNDVEVARDTQAGLKGSDGGLYIGMGNGFEVGTFWSGLIDDVRIYSRVVEP